MWADLRVPWPQEEGYLKIVSSANELTTNVSQRLGKRRRTCLRSDAVISASAREGLLSFTMRYNTGTGSITSV